jgi:hypothetical protein
MKNNLIDGGQTEKAWSPIHLWKKINCDEIGVKGKTHAHKTDQIVLMLLHVLVISTRAQRLRCTMPLLVGLEQDSVL